MKKPELTSWTITTNENGIEMATLPAAQLRQAVAYMESLEQAALARPHHTKTSGPEIIEGNPVVYHVITDREKWALTHENAEMQDLASEYAIVQIAEANGGLMVYAKYSGTWVVNPWSTRWLIRELLENIGIILPKFNEGK